VEPTAYNELRAASSGQPTWDPERCQPGNRAGAPGPTSATLLLQNNRSLPDRGL